MNKNILYIFLSFLSVQLCGQSISISDPIDLDMAYYYNLLGKKKNSYYFLKGGDLQYQLLCFDEDLKKKWSTDFKMERRRPKFLNTSMYNDKIFVHYIYETKKGAVLRQVKHSLNGNIQDSLNLGLVFDKLGLRPEMNVETSENKKFQFLWNQESNGKINYWVINLEKDSLQLTNSFTIDKAFGPKQYKKFIISNDGLAFLILSTKNQKKKINEHEYKFFKLNTNQSVFKRAFKIAMDGNLTVSVDFTYDNLNKQIIGGGYYGRDSRYKPEGVFYMKIPSNRFEEKLLKFTRIDFSKFTDGKKRNIKNPMADVSVRDLALGRNGELNIISEHIKVRTYEDELNRIGSNKIDYYYTDLYLSAFDADGNLFWINTLKKNQYSQSDDGIYSSFFLFRGSRALRLIFNDKITFSSTVSEYIVRGDGKYDRDILFNTQSKKLGLRIRDSQQIAINECLIPSQQKKTVKLVRVIF